MSESEPRPSLSHVDALARGPRDEGDDFLCLRYRVWYSSWSCAVRTKYRTCRGCADCDQGRFNLKRHAGSLAGARFPIACEGD